MRSLVEILGPLPRVVVIDIGASPAEGAQSFQSLYDRGLCRIIGFEPHPDAYAVLRDNPKPRTVFHNVALGDGHRHPLYLCYSAAMSSLLEPDADMLGRFAAYGDWGAVRERTDIDTVRLDTVIDGTDADLIKIDVQGAELMILQNGLKTLEKCLVVQAETNFLPMYRRQPLFSEIELFLRGQGYMFHSFWEIAKRMVLPLRDSRSPHTGINQIFWADAIFVRRFDDLAGLSSEKLLKLALILNDIYGSVDLVLHVLTIHDRVFGTGHAQPYVDAVNAEAAAGRLTPS